jgi:hypothetical protein
MAEEFKKSTEGCMVCSRVVIPSMPQVINLPFKCSRGVQQLALEFLKTSHLVHIDTHLIDGTTDRVTHTQFIAIATFKMKTHKHLNDDKKKTPITV